MNELFESKLTETRNILSELENLKVDILAISNQNKDYFPIVCKSSKFLTRTYWNSVKLLIIDLHKLLNENEDFSLASTINFAQSNIKRITWKHEISYKELESQKQKLIELEKHNLENLKNIRDKIHAHSDKNKYKFTYELKLEDCWKMLEVSQDIFNKISHHFKNETWMFKTAFDPPKELIFVYKYQLLRKLYFDNILKYQNDKILMMIRKILHGE